MESDGNKRRLAEYAVLLLILAAACGIRVACLADLHAHPNKMVPTRDQYDLVHIDNYARALADRARTLCGMAPLSPPPLSDIRICAFGQRTDEPYVRPPLYTFFVAACYFLFDGSDLWVRAAQMLLGLASALLAWSIGRRLARPAGGLALAAFQGLYWIFPAYEGELVAVPLVILMSLLTLRLIIAWAFAPRPLVLAAAGLSLGLTALSAMAVLLFAPFAYFWHLWCGRVALLEKLRRRRYAALAVALLILPVTVTVPVAFTAAQNYAATGELHLVSFGGFIQLWVGNHDGSDGYISSPHPLLNTPADESYDSRWDKISAVFGVEKTWSDLNKKVKPLFLSWLASNKMLFARLTVTRAVLFWNPREVAHSVQECCIRQFSPALRLLPGRFPDVFVCALAGLLFFLAAGRDSAEPRVRQCVWLVILWGGLWYLPYTVFFVTAMYRGPLLPIMGIVAVSGIVLAPQVWVRRRRLFWGITGSCALAYAGMVSIPVDYSKEYDRWLYFKTHDYAAKSDYQGALKAVDYIPSSGVRAFGMQLSLARLYENAGDKARARETARLALEDARDAEQRLEALRTLADICSQLGDADGVHDSSLKILELDPNDPLALHHEADRLIREGSTAEAIPLLERAVKTGKAPSNSYFLLGMALGQAGRMEEAEQAYRSGVSANPEDVWPMVGLAGLLETRDRLEEAKDVYEKVLARDPGNVQAKEGVARIAARVAGNS